MLIPCPPLDPHVAYSSSFLYPLKLFALLCLFLLSLVSYVFIWMTTPESVALRSEYLSLGIHSFLHGFLTQSPTLKTIVSLFFLKNLVNLTIYVYVCMWGGEYVHLSVVLAEAWDNRHLWIWRLVVNHLTCMLSIELKFSGRTICTLKCWAISVVCVIRISFIILMLVSKTDFHVQEKYSTTELHNPSLHIIFRY